MGVKVSQTCRKKIRQKLVTSKVTNQQKKIPQS